MNDLKIEYVLVNDLTPYENNAREHHDEDIGAIVNSIREFGFNDPIGVWGEDNTIVEGHGRLLAAQSIGMEKVPVIHLDDLTDEQRRAYALAHNKTAELSDWDFGTLESELADIEIDMEQFGFKIDEDEPTEPDEVNYNEKISVVVDCVDDAEAEEVFNKLQAEGYSCRISTV